MKSKTVARIRRMMKERLQPLGPRVAIGYPHGGGITTPFALSLDRARTTFRGLAFVAAGGLYVSKNRNDLVRHFLNLKHRPEYLIQIDTDIEFKPEALARLVELADDGRDIIAADVRLGSVPHTAYAEQGLLYAPMMTLPADAGDVFRVDAAATACMLIRRGVLEAMAEQLGPCWFHLRSIPFQSSDPAAPWGGKEWEEIGEDLAFCSRAKAAGFFTYLARGLGLRHHKRRALEECTT